MRSATPPHRERRLEGETRQQMSDKYIRSVPASAMAGYKDLRDFERGVIVGAREMGHSISEVAMKFVFSRTTISRVYLEYRVSDKTSNFRHRCGRKKDLEKTRPLTSEANP
ncbi:hypothetical protein AVEN_255688-1 [Araneus ventricosus]|uniref:Tc3 transposase DNA binding domain-containing protein n=1 Tax=Araneus ventricosus TaxID=182803 RepID=A0A4Y2BZD0_ARAVE|nr:hypothetical protein AVEN_255688-1 [Araneus ventricosus]